MLDTSFESRVRRKALDRGLLTNRATIYIQDNRFAEARMDLEKALKINPHHLAAQYNLAVALHRLNEKTEALCLLDEVVKRGPRLAKPIAQRGMIRCEGGHVHIAAGKLTEAVADWEKALSLGASRTEALLRKIADAKQKIGS